MCLRVFNLYDNSHKRTRKHTWFMKMDYVNSTNTFLNIDDTNSEITMSGKIYNTDSTGDSQIIQTMFRIFFLKLILPFFTEYIGCISFAIFLDKKNCFDLGITAAYLHNVKFGDTVVQLLSINWLYSNKKYDNFWSFVDSKQPISIYLHV